MRSPWLITPLAVLLASLAWAKYDPIWSLPDIPEGWTPKQAANWSAVQMQYAEARKRFGPESPQAADAEARIIALAKLLNPGDRTVPVQWEPGNNGTLAPASTFDTPPPPNLIQ